MASDVSEHEIFFEHELYFLNTDIFSEHESHELNEFL